MSNSTLGISSVASFSLTPIPLFILMGEVLFHTGLAVKVIDGVERAGKDAEMLRFLDLPRRSGLPFELAVGGEPPRAQLAAHAELVRLGIEAERAVKGLEAQIAAHKTDVEKASIGQWGEPDRRLNMVLQ